MAGQARKRDEANGSGVPATEELAETLPGPVRADTERASRLSPAVGWPSAGEDQMSEHSAAKSPGQESASARQALTILPSSSERSAGEATEVLPRPDYQHRAVDDEVTEVVIAPATTTPSSDSDGRLCHDGAVQASENDERPDVVAAEVHLSYSSPGGDTNDVDSSSDGAAPQGKTVSHRPQLIDRLVVGPLIVVVAVLMYALVASRGDLGAITDFWSDICKALED